MLRPERHLRAKQRDGRAEPRPPSRAAIAAPIIVPWSANVPVVPVGRVVGRHRLRQRGRRCVWAQRGSAAVGARRAANLRVHVGVARARAIPRSCAISSQRGGTLTRRHRTAHRVYLLQSEHTLVRCLTPPVCSLSNSPSRYLGVKAAPRRRTQTAHPATTSIAARRRTWHPPVGGSAERIHSRLSASQLRCLRQPARQRTFRG